MSSLSFLGTGGGRFVTQSQIRYTGGIWLDTGTKNFMIDPGVGTLIRSLEFGKDLGSLDAIFVSHKHLDHYGDCEVCIEGMTHAMNNRRGTLFINKNAAKYISDYHRDMVDLKTFSSVAKHNVEGVTVETVPSFGHDDSFGFKFYLDHAIVTYASDTSYNKELVKHYKGSDLLVLNVLRPDDVKILKHLCISEAKELINQSRPKKAVLTHFGYYLAEADTDKIAKEIEEETGIETIAAQDGQVLGL